MLAVLCTYVMAMKDKGFLITDYQGLTTADCRLRPCLQINIFQTLNFLLSNFSTFCYGNDYFAVAARAVELAKEDILPGRKARFAVNYGYCF